jgi:hypothetical protein
MKHLDSDRRSRTGAFLLAATVAGLLWTQVLNAQTLYRWKDGSGVVQLSDRPPPQGTPFETLNVPRSTMPSAVPPAPAPSTSTPERERAEPTTSQTEPEKDPEQCRLARENLFWLENRARVRVRDEEGELVFLTPDEAEEQRRLAEQAVARHCKD